MGGNAKFKLVIAEENRDLQTKIEQGFVGNEEFEIVDKIFDGTKVVETLKRTDADLLVLNLIMPGKDGFSILEEIFENNLKTKVIVISALSQEIFINKAISLGANYFLIKPFNISTLIERISLVIGDKNNTMTLKTINSDVREMVPKLKTSKARQVEEKITNIFISVGIPAHIKGYQFLREAIKMTIDSPDIINSITKRLYPSIAERFSTSSSKVERAIRHAIEVAWNRGKIENINSIFGIKIYSSNDKPTNGEFIALVADKMLLEGA